MEYVVLRVQDRQNQKVGVSCRENAEYPAQIKILQRD
jgi:hypothetical protein